jgi:hypothetical protein
MTSRDLAICAFASSSVLLSATEDCRLIFRVRQPGRILCKL